jgi:RND family efflux transporter MFP subunit
MDIPRTSAAAQRKKKRLIMLVVGIVALAGITFGLTRLKPAAPGVERSTIWTDTVKRGDMLRQVRGLGTLVPEEIRWIPAETEARVERINILPGTKVEKDTVILELSNPQAEQEALDAQWQLNAALAEMKNADVRVRSELMTQQATAATVSTDYNTAKTQAEIDEQLAKLGVISGQALKVSKGRAQELETRHGIEEKRVEINEKAVESQMAVQRARVEQLRALAALRKKQLDSLKVRAGISGVLQEVPVQVGQRVTPGTNLARVAEPSKLKAELRVPETQAKDIQIGQPAQIDTHNGVIKGEVMRVDPAVQNGTVTVDVKLIDELPRGARPELSVDGTINLDELKNVLYVGRPATGTERTTVTMFKVDPDTKGASRVQVQLGRSSVNAIEILGGLKEGDQVVLSDMSRFETADRVRFE